MSLPLHVTQTSILGISHLCPLENRHNVLHFRVWLGNLGADLQKPTAQEADW